MTKKFSNLLALKIDQTLRRHSIFICGSNISGGKTLNNFSTCNGPCGLQEQLIFPHAADKIRGGGLARGRRGLPHPPTNKQRYPHRACVFSCTAKPWCICPNATICVFPVRVFLFSQDSLLLFHRKKVFSFFSFELQKLNNFLKSPWVKAVKQM